MSVYIITYQLHKPDAKKHLDNAILQYEGVPLSDTSFAVASEGAPDEVYATLRSHLNPGDNLLVLPIGQPFSGQAPPELLEWLDSTLG